MCFCVFFSIYAIKPVMKRLLILFILLTNNTYANSIENKLICPKFSEYYQTNSKKTILTIKDLVFTLLDSRDAYDSMMVKAIELSNSKDTELVSVENKRLSELKNAIKEKESRAKENYNNQIMILAEYSAKVKKCWSTYSDSDKKSLSEFLNKFSQNKYLLNFKTCLSYIQTTNNLYEKKFNLSFNYLNKKINHTKLDSDQSMLAKTIFKSKKEEALKCSFLLDDSDKSKLYKKMEEDTDKALDIDPRKSFKFF